MEVADKKYYIVFRVCMLAVFCTAEILLFGFLQMDWSTVSTWLWITATQLCLLAFNTWIMCRFPWVKLGEKSVLVMAFFKTREYAWTDIVQVGILWKEDRGQCFGELAILLPGGSPRKNGDVTFRLRNQGRLIYIFNTPKIRDYLVRYYGPLDFE